MENEIDYTRRTDAELVEMFGRMDPRFAPEQCARLGKLLTERGYIVTQGDTGPGFAEPSPSKLQALIGSSHPYEFNVEFGKSTTLMSYLEQPTHNDLGLAGCGTLRLDGIYVYLSGHSRPRWSNISSRSLTKQQIATRRITNVESLGKLVRFEYDSEELEHDEIIVQLANDSEAAALVAALPKTRTEAYRPQLKADIEFDARVLTRSPRALVTYGLVAVNTLVFIATLFSGAGLFRTTGEVQLAWGSNFGPYTTDGEWWRLFTSLFLHFGLLHVVGNMWVLILFGPLVERLYGGATYLLIYIVAGILGSVASICWHPEVNSAGASGAIFGICGALLAQALFRRGFPSDISRPIRRSTLVFVIWALYASLRHPGVDYVAHLGGLAAGFILGLAATLLAWREPSNTRQDLLRPVLIVGFAMSLLLGGMYCAERSATSLVGDALYYRTVHWMRAHEHAVNAALDSALAHARQNPRELLAILEKTVLPFWGEVGTRLAEIRLPSDSQHIAMLDKLQDLSDRRAEALQRLDKGLRNADPNEVTAAGRELKRIDTLARSSN